jgi:hypothetical protein
MLAPWVSDEMKDVELEDKRLNRRLSEILDALAAHPQASIPSAVNGGEAETTAAYRFFDNHRVDFEDILHPHIEASLRRFAEHSVVILAQDTSEIDLTRPEQQVAGAGTLDGHARHGVLLHPLMGFTPDGTPLGTVYAEAWSRDESRDNTEPRSTAQKQYDRKHAPIEEKESLRWLDSHRQAIRIADQITETQFISVADSEADIYEVIDEAMQHSNLGWIVRACQHRATLGEDDCKQSMQPRDVVMEEPVLFRQQITVRGRTAKVKIDKRSRKQPREPRTAEVEVRAATVKLRAPWRSGRKLSHQEVNVVLVREVNPPGDDVPVEWVLYTNLPITNAEEVRQVIQYYCVRWMIEIFFRTLKSGCRVESRRFEEVNRFYRCLAVYMIVAWRTLYVCRLGREMPDVSCEAVFDIDEWQSIWRVVKDEPPPEEPPRLQQMVRMVAQLGGYINRARDDEPGPQSIAVGLHRLNDIVRCWRLFGPNANKDPTCV